MNRLPIKLLIVLCLHIIGFIVVIKLGYYMAEAPYHPFWGVDYAKRFFAFGGILAVCFALSFITYKIKPLDNKPQKRFFWISYAAFALLFLCIGLYITL